MTVGEPFSVSATIENTGGSQGEQDIELLIEADGTTNSSKGVSVAAGDSMTVTFENVSVDSTGEYNYTIASANDSATGSLTVGEAQRPAGQPIPRISVTPSSPAIGDEITFDASNSTDPDGSTSSYEWLINGTSKTGETVTHTFDTAGEYTVALNVTDDSGATNKTTTTVTVDQPETGAPQGPGDITGNGNAAEDLDGDGLYEDINGDSTVNVLDVQALFANQGSASDNTTAFDFNGDGTVNVLDVQALFAQEI